MRVSTAAVLLASIVAVTAQNTIDVIVGGNGTLTYTPPFVTASVGDTIAFTFTSKNHTITQSTFASPCTNISANGIDSGFAVVPNNSTSFPQYSFTLNNVSAPLWFYCRQIGHCAKGMVFAVNPTANKTYAAFQANAMALAAGSTTSVPAAAAPTSTAAASTPSSNGAIKLSGRSVAGLVSFVGLVAGLLL